MWEVDGIQIVATPGVSLPDAQTVDMLVKLAEAKRSLGINRDNIQALFFNKVSLLKRLFRRLTRYPVYDCFKCKRPLAMISVLLDDGGYYHDLMGWCTKCKTLYFAAMPDPD